MKELHAYWMAPLKPSPTQRTASTMCKRILTPVSIAVDRQVSCAECTRRLEGLIESAEFSLMKLTSYEKMTPQKEYGRSLHVLIAQYAALLPDGNQIKLKYAEVNKKVK